LLGAKSGVVDVNSYRQALDVRRIGGYSAPQAIGCRRELEEVRERRDRLCIACFARAWFHCFFFAEPERPERAINADPLAWYGGDPEQLGEDNYREFLAAIENPETARAMLEDYRAGLGVSTDGGNCGCCPRAHVANWVWLFSSDVRCRSPWCEDRLSRSRSMRTRADGPRARHAESGRPRQVPRTCACVSRVTAGTGK